MIASQIGVPPSERLHTSLFQWDDELRPPKTSMLVRVAAAHSGETVLVHAAAGGVGLAVAELGRILGLRVIGLASAGKHEVLRRYAVEPLDARDPRWPENVRRLAPRGLDIVLDGVGGDSWRKGYALLAPLGPTPRNETP